MSVTTKQYLAVKLSICKHSQEQACSFDAFNLGLTRIAISAGLFAMEHTGYARRFGLICDCRTDFMTALTAVQKSRRHSLLFARSRSIDDCFSVLKMAARLHSCDTTATGVAPSIRLSCAKLLTTDPLTKIAMMTAWYTVGCCDPVTFLGESCSQIREFFRPLSFGLWRLSGSDNVPL
jgi:hypothetical protein